MNKKILVLMLLSSLKLFALECTEKQYSPYFTDVKEERYLFVGVSGSNNNMSVFDKTSIKHDNNIIKAWNFLQMKEIPDIDIMKILVEFNIKDNTYRFLLNDVITCEGESLGMLEGNKIWREITPKSVSEKNLKTLKKYLKIK